MFPGIPSLFQKMLDGLTPFLPFPPASERPFRQQVFTSSVSGLLRFVSKPIELMSRLPESSIAPYLTSLQERVKSEGVRVGSYPLLMKGVYVSLIGLDEKRVRILSEEVGKEIQGRLVSEEEVREWKADKSP